jgi:hypothetical protein
MTIPTHVLNTKPEETIGGSLITEAANDDVEPAPAMPEPTATASTPSTVIPVPGKAPIVVPASAYRFPVPVGRPYEGRTNAELAADLKRLNTDGFEGQQALGYFLVRHDICAIHLEMNFRQQHAPRFRPLVRFLMKAVTLEHIAQSCDRQVIDLHWFANSSKKPRLAPEKYPTIFNSTPFDFVVAEQFAQEIWSAEVKAVALSLSDRLQWEAAIIQKAAIRDRWRVIKNGDVRGKEVRQKGASHIAQALDDAMYKANRSNSIRHIPGMIDAWIASQMVGDKPKKVADMIAMMTGEKRLDVSAIAKRLTSLRTYLR